jgi:hypothetical protein
MEEEAGEEGEVEACLIRRGQGKLRGGKKRERAAQRSGGEERYAAPSNAARTAGCLPARARGKYPAWWGPRVGGLLVVGSRRCQRATGSISGFTPFSGQIKRMC